MKKYDSKSIDYNKLLTPEKHYITLNNYYRALYQRKVYKISLNGGFSCPNLDGTVGSGGCSFCSVLGSGDFAGNKFDPLDRQFKYIKEIMQKKWQDGLLICYFQANTNTYAPVEKLKQLYEQALLLDKNIVKISIGTRPDCLGDDVLDYLEELNKKVDVCIELGLQSIHEQTSAIINRCHNLKCFDEAVYNLKKRNIEVVVHIINGLPYEDKTMMIATAKHLAELPIDGIKIHMLHIMKNTKMALDFRQNSFPILTLDEFVCIAVLQLRYLPKNIVIHRLSGDAPLKNLIVPQWTIKKLVVLNEVDKYMRLHNYFQGDLFKKD